MSNDSATKPTAGIGVTVIRKGQKEKPIQESTGKTVASLLVVCGVMAVVVQGWFWDARLGIILTGAVLTVIGLASVKQ